MTHLHGILGLDCTRRNICEILELFLSWSLFNVERVSWQEAVWASLPHTPHSQTVPFKGARCVTKSDWVPKHWGQLHSGQSSVWRHSCAWHLGALCAISGTEAPCNLSLLETSLGWTWWGFCAIAGIGRNKTCNLSGTKKKKKFKDDFAWIYSWSGEVVVFPCVGWHEIMWMFWFYFLFSNELQDFSRERQTRHVWPCMYLKPLVGLEHLFQKVGSTSTSQMRKYGGGWGG